MTTQQPPQSDDDASGWDEFLDFSVSWTIPLGRLGLANRQVMGWPFGKVTLTNTAIVLSGRGPFRFVRKLIPLDDIVQVERVRGWIVPHGMRTLRFRTRSGRFDRTLVGAWPRRMQFLAERLEELGLSVDRG